MSSHQGSTTSSEEATVKEDGHGRQTTLPAVGHDAPGRSRKHETGVRKSSHEKFDRAEAEGVSAGKRSKGAKFAHLAQASPGRTVQAKGNSKKKRWSLRDLAGPPKDKKREEWQIQKQALQEKFGEEGWNPRKKLSPDAMDGIRNLHAEDPERYSTPVLAEHFKVSPEAIRRILKSKWQVSEEQMQKRRERWARRHDRIWDHQVELGLRPPRTKDRAIEDPEQFDENLKAKEMLDHARRA